MHHYILSIIAYNDMKKANKLIALAESLQNKYANNNILQQIIFNAAAWGENSPNKIMNFPAELQKDNAELSLTITIDTKIFGNKNIVVSTPYVFPSNLTFKYSKLSSQIKNYLSKHINNFNNLQDGTYSIKYSGNN
jgi:hypothetical protein